MKKKTIIHFVRHGIVDKPKDALAGIVNVHYGLAEEGRKQIQNAGEYLSPRKINAIYTSPITRTYESAGIIAEYFPEARIIKSEELFEWKFIWTEKTRSEVIKSPEYQVYLKKPTELRKGEKLEDLADRMHDFCKSLLKKHRGEEIICVSHQDPIRALVLALKNKDLNLLNKVSCERGSITSVYFSGGLDRIKYKELGA